MVRVRSAFGVTVCGAGWLGRSGFLCCWDRVLVRDGTKVSLPSSPVSGFDTEVMEVLERGGVQKQVPRGAHLQLYCECHLNESVATRPQNVPQPPVTPKADLSDEI